MSYRTYVEDIQIFGNNDYYTEWIDFMKSQGIKVDEEGCYKGEIHDFMGALTTIENIVMRLNNTHEEMMERYNGHIGHRKMEGYFDFSRNIARLKLQPEGDRYNNSLFDELLDIINSSYAFMPYVFYQACEEKLKQVHTFTTDGHFHCYELKEGQTIHVEAH